MTRRIRPLGLLLGPALALIACNVAPGDPLVAPDSPVLGVEARSTEGSLFVEVDGPLRWPWETAVRIHIDAFDAEGVLIEEHWGLLTRREDDGEQRQVLWWSTAQRAAVLGVRILADDRVVFSHRLEAIGAVLDAADGPCDTMGARDHCGLGRICWPMANHLGSGGMFERADRYDGRCLAGQARAFRADPRFDEPRQIGAVDLRFPDAPDARGPVHGGAVYPEQGVRRWGGALEPAVDEGFRATMRLFDHTDDARPVSVDVYVGPHLFATDQVLRLPRERALGAACDPARVVDACAAGTLCDGGRCVRAASPMLSDVRARGHRGGVTLWFEARDPEDDIVRYDIEHHVDGLTTAAFDLGAWGAIRDWYPLAGGNLGWTITDGTIESDEGVHRAHLTFDPRRRFHEPGPGLAEVTVTATDAFGGSHAVTVEVEPAAPEPVEDGAACDPLAVEFACRAGSTCDVADGAEAFACHALADPCPSPTVALDEQGIEARWGPEPTPLKVFSCSGYFGEPETPRETHAYSFTAVRGGEHRFIAEPRGAVSAVSIRRRCDLPRTEAGCGNTRYPVGSARLQAGETVHVVVQRPIEALLGGWGWDMNDPDAYALRVELRD